MDLATCLLPLKESTIILTLFTMVKFHLYHARVFNIKPSAVNIWRSFLKLYRVEARYYQSINKLNVYHAKWIDLVVD